MLRSVPGSPCEIVSSFLSVVVVVCNGSRFACINERALKALRISPFVMNKKTE